MTQLNLESFLAAGGDVEAAQYRMLDSLGQIRRAFTNNVIYPHLGELVRLHSALQELSDQLRGFREALPRKMVGLDPETNRVIYERALSGGGHLEGVEEMVRWAMPHIRSAVEEGRAIFEFVEENLHMGEVGLVPSFVEEGYLFVPDKGAAVLHVLRYSLSIIVESGERYRTLKTALVESVEVGTVVPSPQSIKLRLLERTRDLPNPATFFFDTDLDFPFEQTMLPVAKRKLMRHLALSSANGRA